MSSVNRMETELKFFCKQVTQGTSPVWEMFWPDSFLRDFGVYFHTFRENHPKLRTIR